jgi:hypothetical protein
MKLLTALIAMFLLSATAQAQIPFYGGYSALQPYYPGAIGQPYYPQAYYPQPYDFQPGYEPYRYDEHQSAVYDNLAAVDTLERRVQQLTDEVKLLQAEVTASEAQVQTPIQMQRPEASRPAEPAPPVILVLKNGKRLESQGYVIAGGTLWIITRSGSERMSLSNLNSAATQRENLKRGIEFPNLGG